MHVSVCIVGFRNLHDITLCLAALERSTHTDFEVVICENGGAEAFARLTAAVSSSLKDGQPVRCIDAKHNLGFAGGVNVCMNASPQADAWWVLNPDTEPFAGALSSLVDRLAIGDCDAAGCTVQLPGGKVQSHGGEWQPWLARAVSIGHGDAASARADAAQIERRQNFLNGACMLVGREFLLRAGPMREDYFLYCEEVEWCLRALKRGLRLGFAPDAFVLHQVGTTTGNIQDFRKRTRMPIYLSERNRLLLTRDCFPAHLPIVAVSTLAAIFARYARRGAWRQIGYGLSGWWAGLRNERGAPAWTAG
jgi:N-acetylglucosaminyl-diphospho-decaprenol L-rhamnosyltransferase